MVIRHYRFHVGTWAWVFHRISGLALVLYLPLHVWVTHHIARGPDQFNRVMEAMNTPMFKVFEVALLAAVLYHAFNGIRVIMIDLDWLPTARAQRIAFWVAGAICLPILAYAGYAFLSMHAV